MMPPVVVGVASAHRLPESAQHVEMSVGEAQASTARLADDGRRAERFPRVHLLRPSIGALAADADPAFKWKPGGVAAGLTRVLVHARDDGLAVSDGCKVRAPAVGAQRDPPQ